MSVEARIREMLLSSQKNLNEVASSGNDNTNPKQGNSKDASFDDLGDFDKQKPTVATGKDKSAASKAAIAGDSTNPKQGSSKDATWEDLEDTDLGKKASAKMSKDTSIKPAIKGDTRNEETESDEDDMLGASFKNKNPPHVLIGNILAFCNIIRFHIFAICYYQI